MGDLYLLHETAAGYVLVGVKEWEVIAQDTAALQTAIEDYARFSQMTSIVAVQPFKTAEEALENLKAIVDGRTTELLRGFLEQNLPKKKKKFILGLADSNLAKDLSEAGFNVSYDKNVFELLRGCRAHSKKICKQFGGESGMCRFQVGLGHSYSRSKIQSDPNRQDKPIQHAIALVDGLDKNINLFAMRVREWYSWHFPELGKIVTDNVKFAEVVKVIRMKDEFDYDGNWQLLVDAVDGDETMAQEIRTAKDASMGQDIVEADMANIERFADQVIKLAQQRKALTAYLEKKLQVVAPNLQALVGDVLAARLISHAGSLTNLSKYPASTIQILGAEKALFRALKTRGNTPKYGLLFQSSFIGRAAQKNRGRIARYLANKCSIASRIDNFAPVQSNIFGQKLRDQVEQRLTYLAEGTAPQKNLEVMKAAVADYEEQIQLEEKKRRKAAKKEKKRQLEVEEQEAQAP